MKMKPPEVELRYFVRNAVVFLARRRRDPKLGSPHSLGWIFFRHRIMPRMSQGFPCTTGQPPLKASQLEIVF